MYIIADSVDVSIEIFTFLARGVGLPWDCDGIDGQRGPCHEYMPSFSRPLFPPNPECCRRSGSMADIRLM